MAAAFGSLGTILTYGSRTNSTLSKPASVSNGDTLLAFLFVGRSGSYLTPSVASTGFTSAGTAPQNVDASFYATFSCFKKVITDAGSEPSSYTFTHTSASSGGFIVRISGSNGTVNASSTRSEKVASTTRTWNSITPDVDGCYIAAAGFDWADDANNLTPPTGYTERVDATVLYYCDLVQTTAAATGNISHACNSNAFGNSPRGGWLIALEPAASGIAGTASITEDADTVSAAGALAIKGSASITEAADTASGAGTIAIAGTASITEGADTLSATGALSIVGSASITEGADTVSATGALSIAGQAAITEDDDTLSATGESQIVTTGTASITEDADTVSAAGALAIAGQASITEGADTASGAGVIALAGAASITEGADTLSATGSLAIVGQASITEGDDTLSATGEVVPLVADAPDWSASAGVNATTSSTNSTPAIPTSAEGDVLILSAGCLASNTAFVVTKSGTLEWNEIWQGNVGANRAGFWWKRREATETAPTVSNAGRTATNLLTSSIDCYVDAISTGTPIRNTQVVIEPSGPLVGAELVTQGRNSLAVTRFMRMGANAASAPDLLWTEDRDNGTSGGGGARYYGDSQVIEYPSTVPSVSRGGTTNNYASVTFELISANADPDAPSLDWKRGLWVWDFETAVATTGAMNTLIAACGDYGITDLYCYTFNTFVAANRSNIQTFIQKATNAGVRVWGLDGAREYFADADGRAGLEANLQAVVDYNAASGTSQRFYGFQIDCEPPDSGSYTSFHNGVTSSALSTTPGSGDWQDTEALDREYLMQDWVDMHGDMQTLCHAAGLQFATALPTWFDDYFGEPVECTVDSLTQNVFLHLAARADVICIMSYNTDPKNVISRSLYEFLQTGTAEIGFSAETHAGVGSGISYADTAGKNTTTALFADLDVLRNRFHGYPNVYFDNLHDWEGFKAFAAIEDLPDDVIPVDSGGSGNRKRKRYNINEDPDAFQELLEEWRLRKQEVREEEPEREAETPVIVPMPPKMAEVDASRKRLSEALDRAVKGAIKAQEAERAKTAQKQRIAAEKRRIIAEIEALRVAEQLEEAQMRWNALLDDEDEELIALFLAA